MFIEARSTRAKLVMKRWREKDQPRKRRCAEVNVRRGKPRLCREGVCKGRRIGRDTGRSSELHVRERSSAQ